MVGPRRLRVLQIQFGYSPEVLHIAGEQCASGKQRGCGNRAVRDFEAVIFPQSRGKARDTRIQGDERNRPQDLVNLCRLFIGEARESKEFNFTYGGDINGAVPLKDFMDDRKDSAVPIQIIDDDVGIKCVHEFMPQTAVSAPTRRAFFSAL